MIELLAPAMTSVGMLIALWCACILLARSAMPGYRGPRWRRQNWIVFASMVIAAIAASAPFWW